MDLLLPSLDTARCRAARAGTRAQAGWTLSASQRSTRATSGSRRGRACRCAPSRAPSFQRREGGLGHCVCAGGRLAFPPVSPRRAAPVRPTSTNQPPRRATAEQQGISRRSAGDHHVRQGALCLRAPSRASAPPLRAYHAHTRIRSLNSRAGSGAGGGDRAGGPGEDGHG